MDDSVFNVNLQSDVRKCTDSSAYSPSSTAGLDNVDFMLLHSKSSEGGAGSRREGKVNEMASSGEKARILLAIECALPGSIGATNTPTNDLWLGLPPIAVVYDEIDAHVGGRAAVSLANMLSDQSQSTQVVAITHSPSIAAVADTHVVIQKAIDTGTLEGFTPVRASVVIDAERRRELARMASGDLAVQEAQIFADALIRDGLRRRVGSP
jgi:DNA repair protein RecN (Recombination protein N)